MSLSKLWEMVKDREACSPWGCKQLDTTERLSDNKSSFASSMSAPCHVQLWTPFQVFFCRDILQKKNPSFSLTVLFMSRTSITILIRIIYVSILETMLYLPAFAFAITPSYRLNACCLCAKSLQSCPTLCCPMDYCPLGALSMGFSRQEYWSRLPRLCPAGIS